jgi:hypothetical protein
MAGFLDFLGGAAQSVANTVNEDRQRQQIEAFQERLRAQELADYEKKEAIRARIAEAQEMNQIRGIEIDPATGKQFVQRASGYTEVGGTVPEGILASRRAAAESEQRKAELQELGLLGRIKRDEAAIVQGERRATADELRAQAALARANRPSAGRTPKPPTAAETNRQFNPDLEEMGISKQGGKYIQEAGMIEQLDENGEFVAAEAVEVPTSNIADLRKRFEAERSGSVAAPERPSWAVEGATVYKDGKAYIIRNGVPVPKD